jgi:hypothetical protein
METKNMTIEQQPAMVLNQMLNFGYIEKGPNVSLLPESFKPSEHDVICGRGRKIFKHFGNQNFRKIVAGRMGEYCNSASKLQKSFIIRDIVALVRSNSPNAGFVKKSSQQNGRWCVLGDFLSREKTSQAFRDALSGHYRSSNGFKKHLNLNMPSREVSEGTFRASLQVKRATNGTKSQSTNDIVGEHLSVYEAPSFPMIPTKGVGRVYYQQPSAQEQTSLRNFEWASQDVAIPVTDAFDGIIEVLELFPKCTKLDVLEANIFEWLAILLVNDTDKGDDPFEPTPLARYIS